MSHVLSVRLPEELGNRLDRLALRTRRSKAVYVREALEQAMDRLEWEQGVLQNVEDVRAGRRRTVPEAEVRQSLGLDS
jgi:RHH-type rel operon transcriptional repressor/antitoxin RelB